MMTGSKRAVITIGVALAALVAVSHGAQADEFMGLEALPLMLAMVAGLYIAGAVLTFIAFCALNLGIWVLEAAILNRWLGLGRATAFGYAIVANLASTGIGLFWWMAGTRLGWKTALLTQQWERVPFLLVRSFLVTLVIEVLVLFILLRPRPQPSVIVKALVWANLASYLLMALVVLPAGHFYTAWRPLKQAPDAPGRSSSALHNLPSPCICAAGSACRTAVLTGYLEEPTLLVRTSGI